MRQSQVDGHDELDEIVPRTHIPRMTTTGQRTAPSKVAARPPRAHARKAAARVEVPQGISAEEARRVLSAVASSASTVMRTGRVLALDLKPTAGRSATRFLLVKSKRVVAAQPQPAQNDDEPLTPAAARAALKRAYSRGATAAAELLSGPDMLSSDALAERLGLSREAVHQKRRRGELLGIEGAKRGIRFPAWQIGPNGRPPAALPALHEALGEPWAVFRFLRQRHPELGMRTGLEAVTDPRQAAEALALARRGGDFGPAGA